MSKTKVKVSARALLARINRKLAAKDQILKATLGAQAKKDMGEFYIADRRRKAVGDTKVDLEKFGRELGVLDAWEVLS